MTRFLIVLELIFLARTSFWQETKIIKEKRLLHSIYPYILATIGVSILVIFFKNQFIFYASRMHFIFNISLLEIVYGLAFFISITGPIYENIGYLKTNTDKTLRVFFKVNIREQYLVNMVKNGIIILPIIPFLLRFGQAYDLVIIIFNIIFGLRISRYALHIDHTIKDICLKFNPLNYKRNNNFIAIIIKRIPVTIFLKPFSNFIFTILVVFGVSYFKSSFLVLDSPQDSFFSGVALSAMSFSVPLLGQYFLAVFIEYNYFSTISKKIKKSETSYFILLNMLIVLPATLVINALLFSRISIGALIYFNIGWIIYIVEMFFIQFYKGKVIQNKSFIEFDLIKKYKLSWYDVWPLILNNGILAILLFLIKFIFVGLLPPIVPISLYLIFNIVAVIQYRRILYGTYT